ncbi:AAEL000100-PA [Aedes aegypti]|uniref:AAEL000100-PA n=1 Tax=Aedes aegypti TaxID=7159 RepID=Q0C7B0_AEDAE|nr:AAEL000100-PA [Aedes aegypti]
MKPTYQPNHNILNKAPHWIQLYHGSFNEEWLMKQHHNCYHIAGVISKQIVSRNKR